MSTDKIKIGPATDGNSKDETELYIACRDITEKQMSQLLKYYKPQDE
jgi:hypothetical protein